MDAQRASDTVPLEPFQPSSDAIEQVLNRLRATHTNGGAFLTSLHVGSDETFDWFASRNRLLEHDILPRMLVRKEVKDSLPEILIPDTFSTRNPTTTCSFGESGSFSFDNPFLLDGQLAQHLFAGGAYGPESKITGRAAMQLAATFSEAVFGRRYEDVTLFTSYEAWTPWFGGIAWDWTSVLFDKRERDLWILAVTDED